MHREGYFKEYREKNRDKLRERARQNALRYWHMYHGRERIFKWKKLGYASYKEYRKAYYKAWYKNNRRKHLERCAENKRMKSEETSYKRWYAKKYLKK